MRRTIRATIARDINWMYRRIEPTDQASLVYREQCPGLTLWAAIGAGEFRGAWSTGKRAFVCMGTGVYEVFSGGTYTLRGTVVTSTGPVEFAQGLFQLVMVDGVAGYVLTLASNAFAQITSPNFYGSKRVAFLDGRFIFVHPDTQQFYWSAGIDTATAYNALDFASAESQPDNIVAHLVDHREIIFFGEYTTEPWLPIPSQDQIYQRNSGATSEVGCAATFSAQKIDNSVFWVGLDKNGTGMVWKMGGNSGYQPQRVSDHLAEDYLAGSSDLSGSRAWVYQDAGQTFYVLWAPGKDTTLVYDASIGRWHERSELVNGSLARWRAWGHVFAFGLHLVGDGEGNLYRIDETVNKYGSDLMYRETTSPHAVAPSIKWVYFDVMRLNTTLGQTTLTAAPNIEMRYSDNGGETWSSWTPRSLGAIGEFNKPPTWHRLGRAKDRVWQWRVTEDCKCAVIGLDVTSREGTA